MHIQERFGQLVRKQKSMTGRRSHSVAGGKSSSQPKVCIQVAMLVWGGSASERTHLRSALCFHTLECSGPPGHADACKSIVKLAQDELDLAEG